jgi:hypothetical protein
MFMATTISMNIIKISVDIIDVKRANRTTMTAIKYMLAASAV